MPQWSRVGCARLVRFAAATIPGALTLLPAVFFPRSRRCSHIDGGYRSPSGFNVPSDDLSLAGFQVIMYGRFWVITEGWALRPSKTAVRSRKRYSSVSELAAN